ncbi:hypothetical protein WN944_011165 [Citrus x changshan-huyou]|uniref:Uncharacterized protein n=1 Tax=Citrus x changshan-huyou TaxID=2935761 RepID=A0AAP0MV30_9ROSI
MAIMQFCLITNLSRQSLMVGYVHNGLLKAGRWVFDAECEFLRGLVERNPGLYFDICWAFTAGGVDGIVGVRLWFRICDNLRNIDRNKIICFSIAPTR